ncbi:MAG: dihydroneopterin triphosphate diphosphatase [Pseudomonadota bacterium]
MSQPAKKFKRPESVLVVVYTRTGKVLLLRRAGTHQPPLPPPGRRKAHGRQTLLWQSVTGSLAWEEASPVEAARRELHEETGLKPTEGLRDLQHSSRYPILPAWRQRYAPEVQENTEHAFALELPAEILITVNPAEHDAYGWFPFEEAAEKVFSWTNREVILRLKAQG